MLQEISGKTPDQSLAVSEVVARGAAIHAGIVTARSSRSVNTFTADAREALANVVEIHVNSHGLGIEVYRNGERLNDILIPKNTQLPAASSRVYFTVKENTSRVRVKVLQGDAAQADACISIGEVWVDGLPPHLPLRAPIQVRCGCGTNGLIDVMALDMTSGKMARAEIHRSSGLSEDEVTREAAFVRGLKIQ
jgi:molecular chaperone DnaK